MSDVLHVAERFVIHFFSAAGVLLFAFAGIDWTRRKSWLPTLQGVWAFIVPIVASLLVIFLREPWDVFRGGALVKSYVDLTGWALGISLAAWGIYRLTPRFAEIVKEIKGE